MTNLPVVSLYLCNSSTHHTTTTTASIISTYTTVQSPSHHITPVQGTKVSWLLLLVLSLTSECQHLIIEGKL